MSEIAKRLNVSHSTVSRVLNSRGSQYASEETAARIRQLADELNYRPNRLANGLLRGKTYLIGVVMGRCSVSHAACVLEGIRGACQEAGFQVLLGRADMESTSDSTQARLLLDYKVDGLICVTHAWDRSHVLHWLDEVLARELPCVIVDSRAYADKVDCVVTDDVEGAKIATRHLIDLGHRRIAHVSAGDLSTTSIDRRNGYFAALAEARIDYDPALVKGSDYWIDAATEAIDEILDNGSSPTAVFAANDDVAFWVWQVLAKRGLRVPEDISLIGYANSEISVGMGLTTMDQCPGRIGRTAVERVLDQMDHRGGSPTTVELETELIVRQTTAALTTKEE